MRVTRSRLTTRRPCPLCPCLFTFTVTLVVSFFYSNTHQIACPFPIGAGQNPEQCKVATRKGYEGYRQYVSIFILFFLRNFYQMLYHSPTYRTYRRSALQQLYRQICDRRVGDQHHIPYLRFTLAIVPPGSRNSTKVRRSSSQNFLNTPGPPRQYK